MFPISDANKSRTFPIVNLSIIVVNILVYVYEVRISGGLNLSDSRSLSNFFTSWSVIPAEYTRGVDVGAPTVQPVYLTLFSSMFMHGGLLHIGSNMLYLWIFGDNTEDNMGHLKYLLFYLISGVAAGLTHILFNANSPVPSLGASGAIAGVLAAYLVLFPGAQVRTLVIFFGFITLTRISAVIVIGLWFLLQLLQGVTELGEAAGASGVAVWAHIGGFVTGFILVWLFRGPRYRAGQAGYPR